MGATPGSLISALFALVMYYALWGIFNSSIVNFINTHTGTYASFNILLVKILPIIFFVVILSRSIRETGHSEVLRNL